MPTSPAKPNLPPNSPLKPNVFKGVKRESPSKNVFLEENNAIHQILECNSKAANTASGEFRSEPVPQLTTTPCCYLDLFPLYHLSSLAKYDCIPMPLHVFLPSYPV